MWETKIKCKVSKILMDYIISGSEPDRWLVEYHRKETCHFIRGTRLANKEGLTNDFRSRPSL